MAAKYLQLQRFQTHQKKSDAIALVRKHINENISLFKDGEEIAIEYVGPDGRQMYSTAVVKTNVSPAEVFVSVEENETLRIVESENEPADKDVIWLSEDSDDEGERDLKEELRFLKEELRKMKELVNKHDYALSSTIAGGDIITNSEKYALEHSATPEIPDDATDYTEYATEDFTIYSFELFVGNSPLTRFSGADASLYKTQKYYLSLRLYNIGEERIPDDGTVTLTVNHGSEIQYDSEKRILIGTNTGNTTIYATITDGNGLNITNTYVLNFEYNEEPGYETFSEPNVKHIILKSVQTKQILLENINYLCVNEPIWCISECALYIKGEMPNGQIGLFKINGGGGSEDIDSGSTSGDTTAVTSEVIYTVDDEGYLVMSASTQNAIYVDEDGILNINIGGTVDENGVLSLNGVAITGTTPGGDTTTSGSTFEVDGEGVLSIGNTAVDENGILLLNATIGDDGILQITT